MKQVKQRLVALNNVINNRKRKSHSDGILLFIAEATAETNGNVKWILWMVCAFFIIAASAGLGVLIRLAFG